MKHWFLTWNYLLVWSYFYLWSYGDQGAFYKNKSSMGKSLFLFYIYDSYSNSTRVLVKGFDSQQIPQCVWISLWLRIYCFDSGGATSTWHGFDDLFRSPMSSLLAPLIRNEKASKFSVIAKPCSSSPELDLVTLTPASALGTIQISKYRNTVNSMRLASM